jgi:hypothetical protein
MPTSARYPDGRSQHFTFFQRKFLRKAALASLLPLVPRQIENSKCPFRIGDKVAEHWTDEFGKECIYYGECVAFVGILAKKFGLLVNRTTREGRQFVIPALTKQLLVGADLRRIG